MIKLRSKKFIIYFIIISLVFLIDRLTKIYVLKLAESSDYLNILVNNSGLQTSDRDRPGS